MTPVNLAALEGFGSTEARRKRLGQYFSGQPVSRLLLALAARPGIKTVVDPMAGKGDMLLASRDILSGCQRLDGIELDPAVQKLCADEARNISGVRASCLLGSAFDWDTVSGLLTEGYDLVVTNPPYVRYQALMAAAGLTIRMPSALEVRNGLRKCIHELRTLDVEDRSAFLTLVENYSGLSDLAVPSWLLCAGLVKQGGTLAMVVPDAWLNRDYATVVQFVLLRWFDIEFIVEDAHAAWFADAQVKTTLLVARRRRYPMPLHERKDETYLHVTLSSDLADQGSLVGRSPWGKGERPERGFAKQARRVLSGAADELCSGAGWQRVRIADRANAVHIAAQREGWYRELEPFAARDEAARAVVPANIAHILPRNAALTTLTELGVSVGQGLRTGANAFFYVERKSEQNGVTRVALSKLFGHELLDIPTECLQPAIRCQADVPADALTVDTRQVAGRVLALQGWLSKEPRRSASRSLPKTLLAHIQRAAVTRIGSGAEAKTLPMLTAVAPNVRRANPRTGAAERHWYMLPKFAPRHCPDLFVARVNSGRPRTILNPDRGALIDANFSTLRLSPDARISSLTLLAYMNSTLAATLLEHVGSVLGGGALKVEATHLATFPVPVFSGKAQKNLTALGRDLVVGDPSMRLKTQEAIDRVVCDEVFGIGRARDGLQKLRGALDGRIAARQRRK